MVGLEEIYLLPDFDYSQPADKGSYTGDLEVNALRAAAIELFKNARNHPMDCCEAIIKTYLAVEKRILADRSKAND